jgi:hypothetical protein
MSELLVVGQVVANPLLVGLVVGAPATILGYLGYRRSVRLDGVAVASAGIVQRSAEVQQIIDGLSATANLLRADNEALRAENARLKGT